MNRNRILIALGIVVLVLAVSSIVMFSRFPTPSSNIVFEKHGQGSGCNANMGGHGGYFPNTLIAWDSRPNDTIEVGMLVKLGENPFKNFSGFALDMGWYVFLKNAGAYPQAELPDARLGFFGNDTLGQWYAETDGTEWANANYSTPLTINPQEWYLLKFVITHDRDADHHLFFVNGTKVFSITVSPPFPVPYEKRTSFGEMLGAGYVCFGEWYVRELTPNSYVQATPSFGLSLSDISVARTNLGFEG